MSDEPLPLHDGPETLLEPDPSDATLALRELDEVLAAPVSDRVTLGRRLGEIAANHPSFLDAWARLAAWAMDAGDLVAAYAFARTGYHRGLDRIRKAGWSGQGTVPWHHRPNRGFLRSLHELMRAAAAIGELDEARRCHEFLLRLDPDDALGVRDVDVEALRAR